MNTLGKWIILPSCSLPWHSLPQRLCSCSKCCCVPFPFQECHKERITPGREEMSWALGAAGHSCATASPARGIQRSEQGTAACPGHSRMAGGTLGSLQTQREDVREIYLSLAPGSWHLLRHSPAQHWTPSSRAAAVASSSSTQTKPSLMALGRSDARSVAQPFPWPRTWGITPLTALGTLPWIT